MAAITVTTSEMIITLTPLEKLFGLRGDVRVPLTALTAARLVSNPFNAVTGIRAPGLSVPGLIRIGTWRRPGRKLFIVGRRGCPGIHFPSAAIGIPIWWSRPPKVRRSLMSWGDNSRRAAIHGSVRRICGSPPVR